jgi:hypothetical protein
MCGGYTSNSTSGGIALLSDSTAASIDCWWLTPIPVPRWDAAMFSQPGPAPSPRFGHTLTFDPTNYAILLFGGRDASFTILGDCWMIHKPASLTRLYRATLQWVPCGGAFASAPSPRFGHGAAVFRGALYVVGGYVSDGIGGVQARDDMWVLTGYVTDGDVSNGTASWAQVRVESESALSPSPPPASPPLLPSPPSYTRT